MYGSKSEYINLWLRGWCLVDPPASTEIGENAWCFLNLGTIKIEMQNDEYVEVPHGVNKLDAEDRRMLAFARMQVFMAYFKLTHIFSEVRTECARDPSMAEFFGYLQFPLGFNWRNPTQEQRREMQFWETGEDKRLQPELYLRTRWLADERGKKNAQKIMQSHREVHQR